MEKINNETLLICKGGSCFSILTNLFISIINLKIISSFRKKVG